MRVLCFGDSNTYGYDPRAVFGGRYPSEVRWTDRLAAGTGWDVVNAGENGREIPRREGELRRFTELVRREKPDCLVVLLGGNDLLQGAAPGETAERMERFLRQVPALPRERILLIGPPPVSRGAWVPSERLVQDAEELSRRYRALSEELGCRFADGGEWDVELCFDGVHFTEAGHAAFAEGLYQALQGLGK